MKHNEKIIRKAVASAMDTSVHQTARIESVLYLHLVYRTNGAEGMRLKLFGRVSWAVLLAQGFAEAVVSGMQADRAALEEQCRHLSPNLGAAMVVVDARHAARLFLSTRYVFPTDVVTPSLEPWDVALSKLVRDTDA